jgi:hypothetical protein
MVRNATDNLNELEDSYTRNKSQRDALFLKFVLIKYSTCFGQIHCPSSGASTLYTVDLSETYSYLSKLFWEIVHLVGFYYKNYHDARSSECQIELEESDFRYDLEKSHLPLALSNLWTRLVRHNTTKKCADKEGSFQASLEVTGQVQYQPLYNWANILRYLMSRKDGRTRVGLDALEQRKIS